MPRKNIPPKPPTGDANEPPAPAEFCEHWALAAPVWVPRSGYTAPTRLVVRDVEAGLRSLRQQLRGEVT